MKQAIISAALALSLLTPSAAYAGPDENVRDAALAEAATLRAQGWPKSRCYLGVRFAGNTITNGNGALLPGDKILSLNAVSVAGFSTDKMSQQLDGLPAEGEVAVEFERAGARQTTQQKCEDVAGLQRPYLQALDYAAQKKWYECIDALAGQPSDPAYLDLRARCAQVSRKASSYPFQDWRDKSAQVAVAAGAYSPEDQPKLAKALLRGQMDLSRPIYESLVSQVQEWDSGKVWANVQPDKAALRRAAESDLKSRLIDPQSAIIEMPFDFIYGSWTPAFSGQRFEGFMTCGTVNAKNRMGGYTGSTSFISVVDESGIGIYSDMDDATMKYVRPVDTGCAQLVKKLNYIGNAEPAPKNTSPTTSSRPSTADELQKLAGLHASGALSDAEYAAAKAKVLGGN